MSNRRIKKYRPKNVRILPLIGDVTLGQLTDDDREFLREIACRSLDMIQLGAGDNGNFANVDVVLRNLWTYAQQFEETAILRLLTLMASTCLKALHSGAGDVPMVRPTGETKCKSLRHEDRIALVRPIQSAIDLYFELTQTAERRSELIASQYAAQKILIPPVHSFFLVDKGSLTNEDKEEIWHRCGVAFVNGRAVPGFFKTDDLGRLVWRIPTEDAHVVIKEMTPAYFINDERLENIDQL